MDDWFDEIAAGGELPADAAHELLESGFVVIPGPVTAERLGPAYDAAVAGAAPADMRVGSSTTRVSGLVNGGPELDELYIHRPLLEACCRVIGKPFRLSSLLARTVRPESEAQPLHVDFAADEEGWPMVGFIVMVDDFRTDNGSTRFVPGSHRNPAADHERQLLACGPAGSMIVYNGSVWHGHSANRTGEPRRSIQGAYIRRDAVQDPMNIRPETLGRIGSLARSLVA
jgi:hypothetical protein